MIPVGSEACASFQCHCEFDVCNNIGECVSGRCTDGYFGPSCQYVREYDFTLLLNDSEGICRFERDYIVDNITVDVTCDSIPLVTHLAIVGAMASEVCIVYISGGRDVALKQPDNQTSTLGAMTADLAVDCNLEDRDILSSCSATAPGAKKRVGRLVPPTPALLQGAHLWKSQE